jgi:hypothetical protein
MPGSTSEVNGLLADDFPDESSTDTELSREVSAEEATHVLLTSSSRRCRIVSLGALFGIPLVIMMRSLVHTPSRKEIIESVEFWDTSLMPQERCPFLTVAKSTAAGVYMYSPGKQDEHCLWNQKWGDKCLLINAQRQYCIQSSLIIPGCHVYSADVKSLPEDAVWKTSANGVWQKDDTIQVTCSKDPPKVVSLQEHCPFLTVEGSTAAGVYMFSPEDGQALWIQKGGDKCLLNDKSGSYCFQTSLMIPGCHAYSADVESLPEDAVWNKNANGVWQKDDTIQVTCRKELPQKDVKG